MMHLVTNLALAQAVEEIDRAVTQSGMSVERVDRRSWSGLSGGVAVLVYDKYYMRNSSRASLTVTVTDIPGRTEVRAVGAGGGTGGLINFDKGAAGAFEATVRQALSGTILETLAAD